MSYHIERLKICYTMWKVMHTIVKCRRIYTPHYGMATISRLLKIIGLFCKYCLFRRADLQKRPIISRSLLIVATPYNYIYNHTYAHMYGNTCRKIHVHTESGEGRGAEDIRIRRKKEDRVREMTERDRGGKKER